MVLSELAAISGPMPWQGAVWSRLPEQLEAGRLPQALMLTGSSGIGKARLALALARLLLCHQPSGGLNCGQCKACELSRNGAHGDFRWLQPEGDSRVIKIDQIRAAIDFSNQTAGFGRRKVLVIAPADAMNISAANALLKCLEEPAPDTHLLLVSPRLHGVPATIRSRCQLLKLPLPPREDALAWLDRQTGERTSSESLLALAGGRPLQAAALFEGADSEALQAVHTAFEQLLAGQISPVAAAEATAALSMAEFLSLLVEFVERHIRGLDAKALSRAGRGAFELLDRIRAYQAALAAGSNPNRQLLGESLLLTLRDSLLGTADASARIGLLSSSAN